MEPQWKWVLNVHGEIRCHPTFCSSRWADDKEIQHKLEEELKIHNEYTQKNIKEKKHSFGLCTHRHMIDANRGTNSHHTSRVSSHRLAVPWNLRLIQFWGPKHFTRHIKRRTQRLLTCLERLELLVSTLYLQSNKEEAQHTVRTHSPDMEKESLPLHWPALLRIQTLSRNKCMEVEQHHVSQICGIRLSEGCRLPELLLSWGFLKKHSVGV